MLSRHDRTRCQQRGVPLHFLATILDHADIDQPIGSNCRVLRVSRKRAHSLNRDDRLGRYAVIWSDSTAQIVTVMPLHRGQTGARYRRAV